MRSTTLYNLINGLILTKIHESEDFIYYYISDNGDNVSGDFDMEVSLNLGLLLVQLLTQHLDG